MVGAMGPTLCQAPVGRELIEAINLGKVVEAFRMLMRPVDDQVLNGVHVCGGFTGNLLQLSVSSSLKIPFAGLSFAL